MVATFETLGMCGFFFLFQRFFHFTPSEKFLSENFL